MPRLASFFESGDNPNNIHYSRGVFEKGVISEKHTHDDFYEIYYISKGRLTHYINDEIVLLEEGASALLFPEDIHYFANNMEELDGLAIIDNFAFNDIIFHDLCHFLGFNFTFHTVFDKVTVSRRMKQVIAEKLTLFSNFSDETKKEREYLKKNMILMLFYEIIKKSHGGEPEVAPDWLTESMEQMRRSDNLMGGIKRFVELSGKTKEHLNRTLKKHFATTPSEYINELRLIKAAELIVGTNRKITDIIFILGFESIPYFNRIFKKKYKISPREFRKKNRNLFLP